MSKIRLDNKNEKPANDRINNTRKKRKKNGSFTSFWTIVVLFISFLLIKAFNSAWFQSGFIYIGPSGSTLGTGSLVVRETGDMDIGQWRISLSDNGLKIYGENDDSVFETPKSSPFLFVMDTYVQTKLKEGNLRLLTRVKRYSDAQSVTKLNQVSPTHLIIEGELEMESDKFFYSLSLEALSEVLMEFQVDIECISCNNSKIVSQQGQSAQQKEPPITVSMLFKTEKHETFHGFGEQFSLTNMQGQLVPVVTREQGIGRGINPMSSILNLLFGFSGGDTFTTYTFVPHFITNEGRSMYLQHDYSTIFDFRESETHGVSSISTFVQSANTIKGGFIRGEKTQKGYMKMVDVYSENVAGRMMPLPKWVDDGIILGIQGGEERVHSILSDMSEANIPVVGVWLQDWCGRRLQKILGKDQLRLWWNWEPDAHLYPNWPRFVKNITAQGIQVLAYINPYISDVKLANKTSGYKRYLFEEGKENDFLLKDKNGDVFIQSSGPKFEFAMLDVDNPKASEWYKDLIKRHFLSVGVRGWMADFGEALPFESDFLRNDSISAHEYHNRFPKLWARLNQEAVQEMGLENETCYFVRSTHYESPRHTPLLWAGDQLPIYDERDGLGSVIHAHLSSSLSGYTQTHADIGGYTTVPYFPIPFLDFRRSKDVLIRWLEFSAFGAIMRSHEGGIPLANAQPYDLDMLLFVEKAVSIFKSLTPYRRAIFAKQEPLIRPMFLSFPHISEAYKISKQFLYGEDILVAPVLLENVDECPVTLFEGQWVHVWSGQLISVGKGVFKTHVACAYGEPPVFVKNKVWMKAAKSVNESHLLQQFYNLVENSKT